MKNRRGDLRKHSHQPLFDNPQCLKAYTIANLILYIALLAILPVCIWKIEFTKIRGSHMRNDSIRSFAAETRHSKNRRKPATTDADQEQPKKTRKDRRKP